MPELPDLTIFAKNLRGALVGKEVSAVGVHNLFKVNAPQEQFCEKLIGARVADVQRDGKETLFSFSNKARFSAHLMLAGRFSLCRAQELPSIRAKVLSVEFSDGQALSIADTMNLCKVTLTPRASSSPDVLSASFTQDRFLAAARRNGMTNIKEFLITPRNMRGIGNAYADEILYHANLSPANLTGKIPEERLLDLYNSIHVVLQDAIASIESIAPDIISGEERGFLSVHRKDLRITARGEPIIVQTIAGKTTYFVQTQQLY